MIKKWKDEEWKQFRFAGYKNTKRLYALSNMGRIASYKTDLTIDGKLLKGSQTSGYRTLNLLLDNAPTIYIHREIAKLFLPKISKSQKYVIHLNHIRADNHVKNLQWASFEEVVVHQQNSPATIAYRKKQSNLTTGPKLNAKDVAVIKKLLVDKENPITRKNIAIKFGVTEMTIYRIQSGENWAHIKI